MAREPLVCPSCATTHPLDLRFCPDCGMPLTYSGVRGGDLEVSRRHAQARKIKPQYAEGDLVRVATGRQQPEAEMIQGMLLEEGVPSTVKRSAGFDVPDMLAAGPRDILVPASGADVARQVLLESELADTGGSAAVAPGRLFAGLVVAVVLVGLLIWISSTA